MANILIFHDKPNYEEALSKKGHIIFTFSDKDSALQGALTHKFDLALVNADLPKGLEVLKGLRKQLPYFRRRKAIPDPGLTQGPEGQGLSALPPPIATSGKNS
jgi:DNA-binding NarL/FixJ family response regulator